MSLFDDAQPMQTVVIAPLHGLTWLGVEYWPGDMLQLPTAAAEAFAREGIVLPAPQPVPAT